MDGANTPHHRTASPPPPAISRAAKLRSFFSSSSQEQPLPQLPQRKRSVRFEGFPNSQLDGQPGDGERSPLNGSAESQASRISSKLSERIATLETKLNGNAGTQTIVHRSNLRTKPSVPFINTKVDIKPGRTAEEWTATPSTPSSTTASFHNADWSPVSTASTAATSLSPSSSASRNKRQTPEDYQNLSKSASGGADENILPPIEEDSGRFLLIPVQEAPVQVLPTVATVERAAAAKVYFETHFNELLQEPCSPREARRKQFEQKLIDAGCGHEERIVAREDWVRAESHHLRQIRVLRASSLERCVSRLSYSHLFQGAR